MGDGLNRATLLGNLGADPELRFTQGGQPVLSLRMATQESYLDKNKERKERTDWHNVVIWGKRGEALAKFLRKGAMVYVEGSIRTSSYDDREGNKRYKTEIVASDLIPCGERRKGGGAPASGDRPAGAPRNAPPSGGAAEPPEGDHDYPTEGGDDIPF